MNIASLGILNIWRKIQTNVAWRERKHRFLVGETLFSFTHDLWKRLQVSLRYTGRH